MKKVLPFLPERPEKPRDSGLTMVMDKGLSIREAEDFMSVGRRYTDFVKLGFGTSMVTPGISRKISVYKKAGVIPYFGGTLFEAFVIRKMFKEYVKFLDKYKIDLVEVSDGSYDIDTEKKLDYIRKLSKHRTVISEVGRKYTDFVKLGFGTSMVTPGFSKKISVYKKAGVIPYFGGTLFEAFVIRNMFREYVKFLDKYKIDLVEVSDGSYDIDTEKKLEYIRKLSKHRTVISEVGSKKKEVVYTPEQWVAMMKAELDAGSVKVIAEARESGTTGIYNEDGSINNGIINAISQNVKLENVIWEAPMKSQQAWFIKHFGANVNLGNIAPNEIIPLETLRLGLRGDTFFQFLPDELKK